MIKYKLTTQDNFTYNKTLWGPNVTHTTDGEIKSLCCNSWLHFYHTPELAFIMNSYHGAYDNPKLWECEAEGELLDDNGLKGGCTKLTTIKEIPLPTFSMNDVMQVGFRLLNQVIPTLKETMYYPSVDPIKTEIDNFYKLIEENNQIHQIAHFANSLYNKIPVLCEVAYAYYILISPIKPKDGNLVSFDWTPSGINQFKICISKAFALFVSYFDGKPITYEFWDKIIKDKTIVKPLN